MELSQQGHTERFACTIIPNWQIGSNRSKYRSLSTKDTEKGSDGIVSILNARVYKHAYNIITK